MLLTTALLKSNYGIARRFKKRFSKMEYHFAVATKNRRPFIFHGTTGAILDVKAVDQMATDWEPIMVTPNKGIGIQELTEAEKRSVQRRNTLDRAPCIWTRGENDSWGTRCGGSWQFTTGGPRENKAVFCMYCGGRIKFYRRLNM